MTDTETTWAIRDMPHVETPSAAVRSLVVAACVAFQSGSAAQAQGTGTVSGSPLDTLMSTRFWTDVPEAKDFVRQSRQPPETLEFQPTVGVDKVRPTPRSSSGIESLHRELQGAGARNRQRAAERSLRWPPPIERGKSR